MVCLYFRAASIRGPHAASKAAPPIAIGRQRRWFLKRQTRRFQPPAAPLKEQLGQLSHTTVLGRWLRCEALFYAV